MDRRLISHRLLDLLRIEIGEIEAEYEDISPKNNPSGDEANKGPQTKGFGRGSTPSGKERVERIAQATRTFEKLMELKRTEKADAEAVKNDDAETERLRKELLGRLEVLDRRRMASLSAEANAKGETDGQSDEKAEVTMVNEDRKGLVDEDGWADAKRSTS